MLQRGEVVGEGVARGEKLELFLGLTADALAIHGELHRARGWYLLGHAVTLYILESLGGDGLDLRHLEVRPLFLHQRADGRGIGHVDDMRAMRHLMSGCAGVTVHRHHLDPETLQGDDDLLTLLPRAEQHHARGPRTQRCSYFHASPNKKRPLATAGGKQATAAL